MTALPDTAAYRLWHRKYLVRIPKSLMYSPEYVSQSGIPISGDMDVDSAGVNELMTMWQTGAGLALLYRDGAELNFVEKKDKVLLYRDIQQHLTDWRSFAYTGIHYASAPPINDFRMLEAVAMELHYAVQKLQPVEVPTSSMREAILSMNRRRNPGATNAMQRRVTEEDGEVRPYVSIVDEIENYLLGE